VNVSDSVVVHISGGSPTLILNDGATATYNSTLSDLSTGALVFDYTIGANEHTTNLEITSVNLNGATIRDIYGSDVDFSGALNAATNIQITGTVTNDFNGDHISDLLWRQTGGTFTDWQSTGSAFTQNVYVNFVSTAWHLQGSMDFNGDGAADLVWRNTSTGTFSIWNSTGYGFNAQ
jgi:hypothetical protein